MSMTWFVIVTMCMCRTGTFAIILFNWSFVGEEGLASIDIAEIRYSSSEKKRLAVKTHAFDVYNNKS